MSARTSARALAFAVSLVALGLVGVEARAQTPVPASADLRVPTTKVLAIGRFTAQATPSAWRPFIDAEVRQTVELYLNGKIEQWWVRPDQTGVVFLFASDDPKDVQAMLDQLPLGRAGLMEFELIPLGPLSPLRLLLRQPASQDKATP